MKTKIKLHGKLQKIYGESFEFANIKKPIDVVHALDAIFPGFRKHIIDNAKAGGHYEIILDGKSKNAFELMQSEKKIEQVDLVPCLIGYGPAFAVVLGVAAIGIGVFGGLSVAVSAFFIALGVGLLIAGIMYLLTPIPENEPRESSIRASIKNSSFLFQNPSNVSTQGRAIPIVYGRLRVGSYVIGTAVTNFELHLDAQLQRRFKSNRTNALLKIQNSFGSSVSELYRTF
tara:strand:+ start:3420 stop:4109 length:690 start_codon:yes stop_codon:yes gene_type:complete